MDATVSTIIANITAALPALVPVLYTLIIAAGLDIATGSWAAWVSGTFESKYFLEFIKGHILTKITPIMLILLAGVAVGGTDADGGRVLVALGAATATGYLGVVVASIRNNVMDGRAQEKGLPSTVVAPVVISNQPLTDNADGDSV